MVNVFLYFVIGYFTELIINVIVNKVDKTRGQQFNDIEQLWSIIFWPISILITLFAVIYHKVIK